MDADNNTVAEPIPEEPTDGVRGAGAGGRGAALDAALAAYEAALRNWQGRGDEIAAEQADIPWETSPDEIVKSHASDAAWEVLEQWHRPGGFRSSFAQESQYWLDAKQLRRELGEPEPPLIPLDADARGPAADPVYDHDDPRRDAGAEMNME